MRTIRMASATLLGLAMLASTTALACGNPQGAPRSEGDPSHPEELPSHFSESEEPFEPELLLPPLDGYVTDDDADPGELTASLDHGSVPYVDVRRRRILDERGFALGEVTVITFQSESDGARSYLTHRYGSPAQSPVRIAGVEMVRIEAEPFDALVWKGPTFVVTFERGQEVSDAWLEQLARSTVRSIIDRED